MTHAALVQTDAMLAQGQSLNIVANPLYAIAAGQWLFPVLAILVVFILLLVHREQWREFALRRKRSSRIALFLLTAVLSLFPPMVGGWAFRNVPVQIAFESPHLTATAIKLGIYNLYVDHEENQLLPQTHDLRNCVYFLSWAQVHDHAKNCGDDRACIENLNPLSREDIIAKIRESQKTEIPNVSKACKNVDVAKL